MCERSSGKFGSVMKLRSFGYRRNLAWDSAASVPATADYRVHASPSYFVLEPRVAFDAALAATAGQTLTAAVASHGGVEESSSADVSSPHFEATQLFAALAALPQLADHLDTGTRIPDTASISSALNALSLKTLPPPIDYRPLEIAATGLPSTGGGTNIGAWGIWSNVGTIGSIAIDIRATVVTADTAARVDFGTSGDDLLLSCYDGSLTVKWELFQAGTSQTVAVVSSPHISITDIDGIGSQSNLPGTPELEAVSPNLHHLTSYTVDNPTNLQTSFAGISLMVQGTTAQNSEPTSLVAFDWSNVSSWQITYTALSPYPNNRNFIHDGNSGFTFADPQKSYLLNLDLDATDATASGFSHRSTFIENGIAVPVAGPGTLIAQNSILGTDLDRADVVLKNADISDELLVGDSTALAGTVNGLAYSITRESGQIKIILIGHESLTAYEQALRQITFRNTSDNPSGADRRVEISVTNAAFETTSNIAVSTIEVVTVNDAPTPTADTAAVSEDNKIVVSAASGLLANGTDAESDALTVTEFSIDGVSGTFTAEGTTSVHGSGSLTVHTDGSYAFDPGTAYNGLKSGETATETVWYKISDGNGGTATAQLIITIRGVNDTPVTIDPANPGTPSNPVPASNSGHVLPVQNAKDSQHITPLNAGLAIVDPDGDRLIYTAIGLPKGLTINAATGVITGTLDHSASVAGTYHVQITATDPSGAKTTYALQWKVTNPPPIATDGTVSVTSGHTITIPVVQNDSDPDGDPVYIVTASAEAGKIEIGHSGQLKYTARLSFIGKDIVTYQISDGEGGFATGRFVVDVTPDDVAPQGEDSGFRPEIRSSSESQGSPEFNHLSGAVLSAAGGHRGLDAVSRALNSRHYILNAVNGIFANDATGTLRGDADIVSETVDAVSYSHSGNSAGQFNAGPLKGFVLRTAYADANVEMIVETLIGKQSLYLNLTGINHGASDAAVEWTLMLADGRPLPDWIKRDNGRTFIAEVPPGANQVSLKIFATFPDGSAVERYITIDLRTGEIMPIKPPRAGRFVPPVFKDMLIKHTGLTTGEQRRLADFPGLG